MTDEEIVRKRYPRARLAHKPLYDAEGFRSGNMWWIQNAGPASPQSWPRKAWRVVAERIPDDTFKETA